MDLKNSLYYIWVHNTFLFLCFLSSTASSKQNQIRNYSNNLKSNRNTEADKVTVNIIKNCYCENANIVLSGDWRNNDVFTTNGAFATIPPLYKVGIRRDRHFMRHRRLKNVFTLDDRVVKKKKYPGNRFVLMVSSNSTLTRTLTILKESIVWNHEGSFLIVYKNNGDRCSNLQPLLQLAWKFRLLYVTVLCYEGDGHMLRLFTFNPFKKFAPKFWRFVGSHVERGSNWSVYQHELNSASTILYPSICQNLHFDKTRDLGGYAVRMGAFENSRMLRYDKLRTGMSRFGGVNGKMARAIWGYLRASPRVDFYVRPSFVDANGSLQKILQDLLTGKIEFSMNMNQLRDFWRLQTYPQLTDGLCLVSRKLYASATPSLSLALRPRYWPLVILAGLALVVVLKVLARSSLSTGALELARLLAATPQHAHPLHPTGRFLLAVFALLAILLAGRFRSELAALDIAPSPGPMIDSQADLMNSVLPVYGSIGYDEVFRGQGLKRRYHYGTYLECLERLAKAERLVCLYWCYMSSFNVCEGDVFHVSGGLREIYLSFSTAEDWPLYSRFNQLLGRLVEGGIVQHYKSIEADKGRKDKKDCDRKMEHHRSILRGNVEVELELWGLGVAAAMVVFFAEICLYMVKDNLVKGWKRICRILNF